MSQVITTTDLDISLPSVNVDGALAGQVVAAVNGYIDRFTGRSFGAQRVVTERCNLGRVTWLRHQDVTAVNYVKFGFPGRAQSVATTSSYYCTPEGRLMLYGGFNGDMTRYRDYVEVQYSYGTTDVPDDLKLAAVQLASGMYNLAADGGREISSLSVGSYSVTYGKRYASQSDATAVNPQGVIASYKVPRF